MLGHLWNSEMSNCYSGSSATDSTQTSGISGWGADGGKKEPPFGYCGHFCVCFLLVGLKKKISWILYMTRNLRIFCLCRNV